MKKKKYFILTLVFLSFIMLFYFNQKKGFHEDEIYSYGSSNYKYDNIYKSYGYTSKELDYFWNVTFKGNLFNRVGNSLDFLLNIDKKEFSYREDLTKKEPLLKTKEDANEYLSIQKEDLGNYFSVWLNQAIDVHPPLFYFCLHFFSIFSFNHFSKIIGFALNLLFFILTLIGMKKILALEGKDEFSLPAVIFYGMSMAAISTVMFQRMYMMLTCFAVWYLYYLWKFTKEDLRKKDKQIFSLIITGGFLTQYYFCIYAVTSFATYVILNWPDKKKIKDLFWIHFKGALLGLILYPVAIYQVLFSSRGIVGHENIAKTYLEMLTYFIQNIFTKLNLNIILSIILGISLIYVAFKKKLFKQKEFHLLLLPLILSLLVISKISPFLGDSFTFRYIMLLYPLIVILIFYILSFIKSKKFPVVLLVISILLGVSGMILERPTYLYEEYQESLDIAQNHKDDNIIYVVDNDFTFLNAMPEFLIYKKHLIIDINENDLEQINALKEVSQDNEDILCIKNWLDTEKIKDDILNNTDFTKAELISNVSGDVLSTYYKLTK